MERILSEFLCDKKLPWVDKIKHLGNVTKTKAIYKKMILTKRRPDISAGAARLINNYNSLKMRHYL